MQSPTGRSRAREIGSFSAADRLVQSSEPSTSRKVSQLLIAGRLKLSRATVSRCFTNHPAINPETRARVFALAARLGYSHVEKRAPAAHRRTKRQLVFGVLICIELPSFAQAGYANPGQELLNGLSEFARIHQVRLDMHFVRPQDRHLDDPSYAQILRTRRRWDGVVLIYAFPRSVVDEIRPRHPIVSLVDQYGTLAIDCVDVDHYRGINRLVDELHALGHRRIGFFTWHYEVQARWALRRFGAFMEKLAEFGLEVNMDDVVNAGPREVLTVEQAHERAVARTRDGVTAWICAADHQAYDLIAHFKLAGLNVPTDVSVTGFDGIAQPKGTVALSTVQVPHHQIGVAGGKRLLDLVMKRFDAPQHILLDCELRPGATLAAPRAR